MDTLTMADLMRYSTGGSILEGFVTGCHRVFPSAVNHIYLHRQLNIQQRRYFFFRRQRSAAYNIVWPGFVPNWGDYIEIKDYDQIQGLRQACQLARNILLMAWKELKGYGGFPKSVCTSVHNVYFLGYFDHRMGYFDLRLRLRLQIEGFEVKIVRLFDHSIVEVYLREYHGDTSFVGNVDKCGRALVEIARRCRDEAIAVCKPGAPFSAIGNTVRGKFTKQRKFASVGFAAIAKHFFPLKNMIEVTPATVSKSTMSLKTNVFLCGKGQSVADSYLGILWSSAFIAVSKGHVSL
ncbi:hypothetical protein XELAEV_18047168mg [Xenopus laevis]|uniref:Peptidase M24 domain-containing protein n=1 Tax=Xenopus laevis TaxID=8355 RepID=A0A974BUW6_XENLA|nr:hypothetical protein XELAEV_18047168mg [Xenopus laevis]